ncbi:MAG: hypothetical protein ACJA2W_000778 [Planctomycetota bacterium]|jgi:hypothetical protein
MGASIVDPDQMAKGVFGCPLTSMRISIPLVVVWVQASISEAEALAAMAKPSSVRMAGFFISVIIQVDFVAGRNQARLQWIERITNSYSTWV